MSAGKISAVGTNIVKRTIMDFTLLNSQSKCSSEVEGQTATCRIL